MRYGYFSLTNSVIISDFSKWDLKFLDNTENESPHDMELETTATWLEIEALKQEPDSSLYNVCVHDAN